MKYPWVHNLNVPYTKSGKKPIPLRLAAYPIRADAIRKHIEGGDSNAQICHGFLDNPAIVRKSVSRTPTNAQPCRSMLCIGVGVYGVSIVKDDDFPSF
jgi:hypothetical protein